MIFAPGVVVVVPVVCCYFYSALVFQRKLTRPERMLKKMVPFLEVQDEMLQNFSHEAQKCLSLG